MAPEISVLMPVFNAVDAVQQAARSVLDGTHKDLELVCVDDGSTDGTAEILSGLACADPRVVVITRPHEGLVRALNAGLAACRGPLIARMDADDVAHPTRLARQHDMMRGDGLDLVSCLVHVSGANADPEVGMARYERWVNSVVSSQAIAQNRFIESPIPHPTVLARRQVFDGGYRVDELPEDYELWLRNLARGARFGKVAEVLLDWADSPDRATRTDPRYSPEAFRQLKIRYLLEGPLRGVNEVIVWGAGPNGKHWLKALPGAGISVPYVVEVDPRKHGQTIHGAFAITPEDMLAKRAGRLVLSAVGALGARAKIRAWMAQHGLVETVDHWMVC